MKIIKLWALFLLAPAIASAASYSGSLSYIDSTSHGFYAENDHPQDNGWQTSSALSWTVSNEESGAPDGFDWFYSYEITVDNFAPVRWVIETGNDFTASNIDLTSVKIYDSDNSQITYDPSSKISFGTFSADTEGISGMPTGRYGMFWDDTGTGGNNSQSTTITFWSDVAPVWGDLYSNCGGNGNRGWNSGFETDNPLDAAADGTIQNHVLTPGVIPEPSGVLMASAVLAAAFWIRRRFVITRAPHGGWPSQRG